MILANFEGVAWTEAAPGLRAKVVVRDGWRARLLELSEGFVEPEPCTRGHAFHVLEGACSLEAHGATVRLSRGDVGLIGDGVEHGHRLRLSPGERALLLVFDVSQPV